MSIIDCSWWFVLSATLVWFACFCAGIRVTVFAVRVSPSWRGRFGCFGFVLASALCLRASRVAPVRGGTYFSLPPQRKVGKRKRLTPPTLLAA
ncbi:hypothetical protein [Paraburkholderia hospita]|uniref:hypothetical protein n=3 Tax=Paraburkholderia hospita TaxID=169430 RepID=UPI0015914E05|nr:hypothetical protein [Paraburkholderia hospita]